MLKVTDQSLIVKDLEKDFLRLAAHVDKQYEPEEAEDASKPSDRLAAITSDWHQHHIVEGDEAKALAGWLAEIYTLIDEKMKRKKSAMTS